MVQAVNVLNIFSTFLFVAILLLIYAYLPMSVDLNIDGIGNIHKHRFFYYTISIFIIINITSRIILNLGFKSANQNLLAWLTLMIFILNSYLTFMTGFIGVWNNATHISPANYSYLNFLGPVFLMIWIVGLIFLTTKKK